MVDGVYLRSINQSLIRIIKTRSKFFYINNGHARPSHTTFKNCQNPFNVHPYPKEIIQKEFSKKIFFERGGGLVTKSKVREREREKKNPQHAFHGISLPFISAFPHPFPPLPSPVDISPRSALLSACHARHFLHTQRLAFEPDSRGPGSHLGRSGALPGHHLRSRLPPMAGR